LESKINRITDILRRDDGISGAMHYTEQISWILFLKFLLIAKLQLRNVLLVS